MSRNESDKAGWRLRMCEIKQVDNREMAMTMTELRSDIMEQPYEAQQFLMVKRYPGVKCHLNSPRICYSHVLRHTVLMVFGGLEGWRLGI
jgi:hypothetical protein